MSSAAPATRARPAERVAELDVLRGVILFLVFLLNMTDCGRTVATEQQLRALPSAWLDFPLYTVCDWLIDDKSITLFSFMFGLGFHLQMQGASARGADFSLLYRRRLLFLFALGLAHLYFVWSEDILHVYALTGFVLFALRNISDRALILTAVSLALFGDFAVIRFCELLGMTGWHGLPSPHSAAAVLEKQRLLLEGRYAELVRFYGEYTFTWVGLDGGLLQMFVFALPRFLLGMWVGRRGWFRDCPRYLPGFRLMLYVGLPLGLLAEAFVWLVHGKVLTFHHGVALADKVHLVALWPVAAGYASAVVVIFHTSLGRRLLAPFSFVGRMALTSYLSQSVFYGLIFSGVGPGLALAGKIGVAQMIGLLIVAYALQVAFSRWWLARYSFGPVEWLWRAFTYNRLPTLRLTPRLSTPTAS